MRRAFLLAFLIAACAPSPQPIKVRPNRMPKWIVIEEVGTLSIPVVSEKYGAAEYTITTVETDRGFGGYVRSVQQPIEPGSYCCIGSWHPTTTSAVVDEYLNTLITPGTDYVAAKEEPLMQKGRPLEFIIEECDVPPEPTFIDMLEQLLNGDAYRVLGRE